MTITVNRVETILQGRVFDITRETIELPNRARVTLEVIRHPGASAIVPVMADGRAVLIRQYRHALGGYIWEIPAGTLAPGESPLECAKRELTEETGYEAESFEKIGEITPVPGYSDERVHLFRARGLSPAARRLDADEVIDVHMFAWDRVLAMVETGEIQDAKTICGLMLADRRRDR